MIQSFIYNRFEIEDVLSGEFKIKNANLGSPEDIVNSLTTLIQFMDLEEVLKVTHTSKDDFTGQIFFSFEGKETTTKPEFLDAISKWQNLLHPEIDSSQVKSFIGEIESFAHRIKRDNQDMVFFLTDNDEGFERVRVGMPKNWLYLKCPSKRHSTEIYSYLYKKGYKSGGFRENGGRYIVVLGVEKDSTDNTKKGCALLIACLLFIFAAAFYLL